MTNTKTKEVDHDALVKVWLFNNSELNRLKAASDKLKKEQQEVALQLITHLKDQKAKSLGGVLCWSRLNESATIVPILKKGKKEDIIPLLLADETFLAFTGERVMGNKVLEVATEDKSFRKALERRELITRHLDESMLAKAAVDNPQLQAVLKKHKVKAVVSKTRSWYLKQKK